MGGWGSVNSIEDGLDEEEGEEKGEQPDWAVDLADRVEQILDRKRSSGAGREESLVAFGRLLSSRYAYEEIHGSREALVVALLRSVKSEVSERESTLALKGRWSLKIFT